MNKKIFGILAVLMVLATSCFAVDYVLYKEWGPFKDYYDREETYSDLRVFEDDTFNELFDTYSSLFGKPVTIDVKDYWNEVDYFAFYTLGKDSYVLLTDKEGQKYLILTGRLYNELENVVIMWSRD